VRGSGFYSVIGTLSLHIFGLLFLLPAMLIHPS